ncbi:MAG: hypothetical protein Q7T25_13665 [Sideroxyarcus sp.]|nr:hypothetical protein [Sideroxyarcus sp.]
MSKSNHFVIFMSLLLAACSSDFYQGLYEGVKSVNDAKRTPAERAISPIPSYNTYKKEREQKQ